MPALSPANASFADPVLELGGVVEHDVRFPRVLVVVGEHVVPLADLDSIGVPIV
mgnify:CR=1 FL=1